MVSARFTDVVLFRHGETSSFQSSEPWAPPSAVKPDQSEPPLRQCPSRHAYAVDEIDRSLRNRPVEGDGIIAEGLVPNSCDDKPW